MNQPASQSITRMLRQWNDGNGEALDTLLPLVYDELRRQAARYMRRERANHTLQTSALINEAYLKLIDQKETNWESRNHFFAIAAQAMRRILVDYARKKNSDKRGGVGDDLPLDEITIAIPEGNNVDLIALDEALSRLMQKDEQQARVVELRYFSGLTLEETAEALHISRSTAAQEWNLGEISQSARSSRFNLRSVGFA